MRNRLELRPAQQQKLTPGLHNLIQLLTLSNLELSDRVMEMLVENPLLELSDIAEDLEPVPLEDPALNLDSAADTDFAVDELLEELAQSGIDPASQIDGEVDWDEEPSQWLEQENSRTESQLSVEDNSATETLIEHLEKQLKGTRWTPEEKTIARSIFHALDVNGFLGQDLEDLAAEHPDPCPDCLVQYQSVLRRVQEFTPAGIAARNLQESLLIQLRDLPQSTDMREYAVVLVQNHFESLVARNLSVIGQLLDVSGGEVQDVLQLIGSLNPRPAAVFREDVAAYVEPEVRVRKHHGEWVVELLNSNLPDIQISPNITRYQLTAATPEERRYLKQKELDAKLLIEGIAYRSQTILKTAQAIVAEQLDFLEQGEVAMRPLVRAEIAQEIGVHESTISRVTANKYIATPRGVFELGYFFSSKVQTTYGADISSVAIRAMIKEFISSEDRRRPLSDQKLKEMLESKNIRIARRTVAKYREAMSIPASSDRTALLLKVS